MDNQNSTPIPHSILCELLGQVQFTTIDEQDVEIAESIMGQEYHSMKYFLDVVKGSIINPKFLKEFNRRIPSFEESEFFAPYFQSHP